MLKITMLLAIIMCAPRSYRCYELLNSSIPSTVDPRISEPHSSEAPDYPNPEK